MFEKESGRRREVDWPSGLKYAILATGVGTEKERGMTELIKRGRMMNVVTMTYPTHFVKEDRYNALLDAAPGLVAVMKVLQASASTLGLHRLADLQLKRDLMMKRIRGLLQTKYGKPYPVSHGDSLIVANDVLPQIWDAQRGSWESMNKPKPLGKKANKSEIKYNWERLLTEKNTYLDIPEYGPVIQLRYRCGGAGFNPITLSGAWGEPELYSLVKPFEMDILAKYADETPDDILLRTNGAIEWQNKDVFWPHVMQIGGASLGDPEFPRAQEYFRHFILGHLPGVRDLMQKSYDFSLSTKRNTGPMTNDIDAMMKIDIPIEDDFEKSMTMADVLAERGINDYGVWIQWKTTDLVSDFVL